MPTVQVEGLGNVQFPDGMAEEEMTRHIQQALAEKNVPPTSGPIGPKVPEPDMEPTVGQNAAYEAVEGAKGFGKGAVATSQGLNDLISPKGSFFDTGHVMNTDASNPDQMMGKGLEGVAEMALPAIKGAEALPSARRAGQVFESIAKDAAQAPVNLKRAGDTLLELHELGATGSNLPKAVRQLTNRATAPGAADILYPEARKFASRISNSSIAERLTSDPNLKRVLGSLREGFNADVGEAAASVGRGHDYEQAMREFANAKKLQRVGATVGTAAASGLGIGAKLGVLGHILGNITGGQ